MALTSFNAGELKLISRDPQTRERTKVVVLNSLLAASRAVLDLDENSHLWYRHPSDSLKGAIENLESWPQTTSTGLEMEANREAANRAVQKSQYLRGALGELKAVAEGRSVKISETLKFQAKQGGEKIITRDRIQLDGVFLTSKVVVMNEANWGLSRDKVKKCQSQIGFIEYVVCPLYFAFATIMPPMNMMAEGLINNCRQWEAELIEENTATQEEQDVIHARIENIETNFHESQAIFEF